MSGTARTVGVVEPWHGGDPIQVQVTVWDSGHSTVDIEGDPSYLHPLDAMKLAELITKAAEQAGRINVERGVA